MSKIKWYAIAIVACLIITNPSITTFKEYIGLNTYSGIHKDRNYFVCSVFSWDRTGITYVGAVGNIFRFRPHVAKQNAVIIDTSKVDSTVAIDPSYKDNSNKGVDLFAKPDSVQRDEYGIPVKLK